MGKTKPSLHSMSPFGWNSAWGEVSELHLMCFISHFLILFPPHQGSVILLPVLGHLETSRELCLNLLHTGNNQQFSNIMSPFPRYQSAEMTAESHFATAFLCPPWVLEKKDKLFLQEMELSPITILYSRQKLDPSIMWVIDL